jgi:hypothetical protein
MLFVRIDEPGAVCRVLEDACLPAYKHRRHDAVNVLIP